MAIDFPGVRGCLAHVASVVVSFDRFGCGVKGVFFGVCEGGLASAAKRGLGCYGVLFWPQIYLKAGKALVGLAFSLFGDAFFLGGGRGLILLVPQV